MAARQWWNYRPANAGWADAATRSPGHRDGRAARHRRSFRPGTPGHAATPTAETPIMPTQTAKRRARRDARQGKKPSTQAGEFVREEMHDMKRGKGTARSRKQAIAIGLSEARRSGVKLGAPKKGKTSAATRKKAKRDTQVGQGKRKPSPSRSRGAKKAARTRARRTK